MNFGAPTHPLRILLIEDDEDDFILVRDALEALGSEKKMTLEWVEDPERGLELLQAGGHDVCLLDYRLGIYTGLELLELARQRGVHTPIILMTGLGDDMVDRQALEAGAADFMVKSQMTPVLLQRSIRYTVQHARTLAELRRSQSSFRELIERLPDGICVLRERRLIYANPALVALVGCDSADELLGRELSDLASAFFQPEDWQALRRDEPGVLKARGPMAFREFRLRRKSGDIIVAEMARFAVVFDGQPSAMCIARDLTERNQMQSRLMLADRMAALGMVAGMVAHDINNPLAYVLTNLHTLESDVLPRLPLATGEREEVRGLLSDAQLGAVRAREVVQQFRIFSSGEKEPRAEPLEVHRVLESALRMAGNEIRHRARLVRDYTEPLTAQASEGPLGQVFLNLLVNAAQAIPEGAVEGNEIRLVTRRAAGEVRIEVHDTGVGIPPDRLTRVFDPFYTTKPRGVGTGLGLSICRDIVSGFGGRLELESEVGRGSVFRVILPAAATPEVVARSRLTTEPVLAKVRRGRILIVDDEPLVSQAIRRALQREHEVMALTSAREAHQRLTGGESFDIILCDIMMPEMSGMDLHEQLARVSPAQAERMVFLTGGAFTPKAREFLSHVKNPRMEKPFLPKELQALVHSLLSGSAASPS
ncbi:ATP-binding response regulator [Hyalangium rubrum]|uniref:histidine kinase n=1 Tax=Hyalangium rubrum TaxID=3103134 RepID=A0ABU5HDQ5_9BACT|nr:response regulator [Hyalangium sp. s54d21]MDY7231405.1 response regulator [Hyalangium sp. s54d21]